MAFKIVWWFSCLFCVALTPLAVISGATPAGVFFGLFAVTGILASCYYVITGNIPYDTAN